MPRKARIEGAGLIHHVTGHAHRTVAAFPDDQSMRGFLSLLADTALRLDWHVFAYCILSTHYHLLAKTDQPNLGEGMRHVHGLHAQRLNRRLESSGPVWRDRYHSKVVRDGRYIVRAALYIDTNPVFAGICDDPADWPWSSYRANAGLAEAPGWHVVDRLHACLGASTDEASEVYRGLVTATLEAAQARRASSA